MHLHENNEHPTKLKSDSRIWQMIEYSYDRNRFNEKEKDSICLFSVMDNELKIKKGNASLL